MKITIKKNGKLLGQKDISHLDEVLFGRSKVNQVILQDPFISRKHARLSLDEGQWYLENLSEENSTKLNGEIIERKSIHDGDIFNIGPYQLLFVVDLQKRDPDQTLADYRNSEDELSELTPAIRMEDSQAFMDAISVVSQEELKTRVQIDLSEETDIAKNDAKDFLSKHPHRKLKDTSESEVSGQDPSSETLKKNKAQTQARLVCLDQDRVGEEIILDQEQMTITDNGDENENHQATIILQEDKTFVIEQEGEHSATYIDGVPVDQKQLNNHDVIQIGDSRYEFVKEGSYPSTRRPRVLEQNRPYSFFCHPFFDSPFRLALLGLLIGLSSYLLFSLSLNPKKPEPTAQKKTNPLDPESQRIALYHLTGAQELLDEGKYTEAEGRIRLVLDQHPDHEGALKLTKKADKLRKEEQERIRQMRLNIARTHSQIQDLLEQGDRLVADKKFDEALKLYKKANSLDPKNEESAAALKHLEDVKEQSKRNRLALQTERTQANKMFAQGVKDFERGQFDAARKLLKQVTRMKGHSHGRRARNILKEINRKEEAMVAAQLKEVQTFIDVGNIEKAAGILSGLQKRYPKNKQVKAQSTRLQDELNGQARNAYREGLTLLEIANDPAAALDQFEKAKRLAPGKNSEYYKKAQKKINELKLDP